MRPLTLLLAAVLLLASSSVHGVNAPAERAERWYKGNTHTHTLWSDGNDFPEMVADWYRSNGYHFLALSDHNILSRGDRWMETAAVRKRVKGAATDPVERLKARFGAEAVRMRTRDGREQIRISPLDEVRGRFEKAGEFILIEAEEITDDFKRKPVHINAMNLAELIKPRHGSGIQDTMRNNLAAVAEHARASGRRIMAHLNHANFGYAITAEDMAAVALLKYFEVYNGHPSVNHEGDASHAGDERAWDIANTIRVGDMKTRPIYGVATDDSHHYHGIGGATTGRGWIQVRAPQLTADHLVEAMDEGDFYASSGVELSALHYDGESLSISVDGRPGDEYTVRFIGTLESTDRTGQPVVNSNGVTLRVTRTYNAAVGAVLQETKGTEARYRLTGKELFVRAHVLSSRPHPNASFKGQVEEAWTQPVGWERRVR